MKRRHDIDALRVLAFGLLILYHVGMFYVADWGWHVKSQYQAEWLQLPMRLVNQWRMPLLFIISGLALSFVVGRYSPGRLALRRIWRLLLPLVFGMAFIVSPQCYYEALTKGLIEPGYGRFMLQYLTFQDFPGDAWGGEEIIVWTWNHLWYLAYILFYTLVLMGLLAVAREPLGWLRRQVARLRGAWLLGLPVGVLLIYGQLVYPAFPYISHALLDDWYAHAMYGSLFFFGFLIGRDDGLWAEFARLRHVTLAGAVAMFVALNLTDHQLVIYLNRWLWLMTVFGWGYHALNRPLRWLPYATEAVYPWYILHQTITVVLGYQLARLSLGPVVEPLLVLGGTVLGCYVLHEYVIRRTRLLRPLFGLASGPAGSRSNGSVLFSRRTKVL
jgi:glucans biosynthesis protein C